MKAWTFMNSGSLTNSEMKWSMCLGHKKDKIWPHWTRQLCLVASHVHHLDNHVKTCPFLLSYFKSHRIISLEGFHGCRIYSFYDINHPLNGVGWYLLTEQVGLFAAKRVAFLHILSFSDPGGIRLPPSSIHGTLKPRMPSNAILSLLHWWCQNSLTWFPW